jgi:5-methyltetrahydrofolate--homocysteine methyltransferase
VNRTVEELVRDEYVVLDGALGTLLQERGLTPAEVPEEWNLTHPEVLAKIHLDYLQAGAQIIETNTFGGNSLKLQAKGTEELHEKINREGVRIALRARGAFRSAVEHRSDHGGASPAADETFIAGSIGPTGKIFEMGLKREEADSAYGEQGSILAEEGVDLFIVETMLDVREAETAVKALKRETALPVFTSMVFSRTRKGEFRTLFGNGVAESVKRLIDAGAGAVGVNCGLIQEYVQVIKQMRDRTGLPLLLYPNAGLPVLRDGKTVYNETPSHMIRFLDESMGAGATIIGGCCGTTPEYIRLIAGRIRGRKLSRHLPP